MFKLCFVAQLIELCDRVSIPCASTKNVCVITVYQFYQNYADIRVYRDVHDLSINQLIAEFYQLTKAQTIN